MKRLYSLVLLALACLIVPAVASATVITSSAGATPTIKAESEGHVVIHNSIANIECGGLIEAELKGHGTSVTATSTVKAFAFSNCTNDWHVTVSLPGSLEIHTKNDGPNGTVTSTGATLEATRFGVSCRYQTNATDIGTITGGSPATLHLEAVLPRHGGSFLCGGSTANWTGSYKINSPSALSFDIAPAATSITSPEGATAPQTFKAVSKGHIRFTSVIANIECGWSFEGILEEPSEAESAEVALTNVSTYNCTGGSTVKVVTPGRLEIDWSSGSNGTVRWTGGTVEWSGGMLCKYATNLTHFGSLTGGSPAKIDVSASIPTHGGAFCLNGGNPTPTEGSFEVTSPSSLFVDKAS